MTVPKDIEEWAAENPVVGEWLTSVGDKTKPVYGRRFKNFYEWLTAKPEFQGMSPAQLLDHQDQATGRQRARIANQLSIYLGELAEKYRPKTLTHYYSSTRSFFSYHGCELPRRRFSLPDNYHRQAPQVLDRAKLVKIIQVAKLRDRAVYMFCAMGGLGWREFDIINREKWPDIKQQLDEGRDRLVLNAPARKRNRVTGKPFPVVIGRDAVKLLREYLKKRGSPDLDGQPIFIRHNHAGRGVKDEGIKPRPFRKNFENLARRAQLIQGKGEDRTNRYGISPHQLRDVFRSEWQRSGADPQVAELLLGHVVDPNQYLKFTEEYILEQYERAEPRLSYVTVPTLGVVSVDEVERLRRELDEAKQGRDTRVQALEERLNKYEALITRIMNKIEAEQT